MSKSQLRAKFKYFMLKLQHVINLIYLFLELHMPKIVLFFAMLLSVYDKCALYIIIIILISISFVFGRPVHTFAIYISSVLVSLLLLARMIYQIEYIEHDRWNVTCVSEFNQTKPDKPLIPCTLKVFPNITEIKSFALSSWNESMRAGLAEDTPQLVNYTYNNAEWLGFHKIDRDNSLPHLVKWNIIYIAAVTVWAVVLVRQFNYRVSRGEPTTRPYFMFPRIKRADADKNLKCCVKYLLNFCFYKFGIEVGSFGFLEIGSRAFKLQLSFMAAVMLIGFRMDMYAVLHAIWLCAMFSLNRKTLSRMWNCYLVFIAVSLPIQYFMTVGLPPSFCISNPQSNYHFAFCIKKFIRVPVDVQRITS